MTTAETSGIKAMPALEPGDRAPVFVLRDQSGAETAPLEDRFSGKPAVLIFRTGLADSQTQKELTAFQARQDEFAAEQASLFVVTRDSVSENEKAAATNGLGLTLLSDENGDVARSFGIHHGEVVTLVLDPNYRIAAWLGPEERFNHLEAALAAITALQRDRTSDILVQHPPGNDTLVSHQTGHVYWVSV